MEKELKDLEKKIDKVLFVLVDDPQVGHVGLGTDVKILKEVARKNSNDIKDINKDLKARDFKNILKGTAIGGGGIGGIVKYGAAIKAFFFT